jgi:hypothetical protein
MMSAMARARRLRHVAGVVMRREEDEAFLLEPGTGRLKLLNVTGLEVWLRLDGERDTAQVAAAVAAAYPEAAAADVAADVERFVAELVVAGLVEVVPGER